MNVPVCWRSKSQRGVTLSSSKVEYVAMSEAVKEIKFIYYLLREIGIEVNLLITVKTDNAGAMFMAKNASIAVPSDKETSNNNMPSNLLYKMLFVT
jgi:hypothetical protein